jgi:hypothetical protein
MSKVFIEETTLTNIGAAIREKTGKNDLIAPSDMPKEIRGIVSGGGGGEDFEPIVLTGNCKYACNGALAIKFIELYPDKITTDKMNDTSYMFTDYPLTEIPFNINLVSNSTIAAMTNMFSNAKNLKYISDITYTPTSYTDAAYLIYNCSSLEHLPYIYNFYPSAMPNFCAHCYILKEIPDDYFDTWNFNRIKTYNYSTVNSIFAYCYSLRKIPVSFFEKIKGSTINKTASTTFYYNMVDNCFTLDEVVNIPVDYTNMKTNMFGYTFRKCCRLKRITFETNEDNTPIKANWSSQSILLSGAGYSTAPTFILDYNSGITEDKEVTDDVTYHALKNDKDWFTQNKSYSRYNRTSAVETINSLPDTSEYLATTNGFNSIQFTKGSGALTDGGAVDTMTEEEIAIATAKGWSVSFVN